MATLPDNEEVVVKVKVMGAEVESLKQGQVKMEKKVDELQNTVGEINTGVAVLQSITKDTREDIATISSKIDLMNYVPRPEIDNRFNEAYSKHDRDLHTVHLRIDRMEDKVSTIDEKLGDQNVEIASTPWKTHIKTYSSVVGLISLIGSVIYWVMVAYGGHP